MSRYIDAEALKEKYTMVIKRYSRGIMERPAVLLETIDDAPSIDIVRCKECKHCKRKKGTFRGEPIFFYRCAEHSRDVESDDYCSWGERSE